MCLQATSSITTTLSITQNKSTTSHGGHPTKISQEFLRLLKTFGTMAIHLEATTGATIAVWKLMLLMKTTLIITRKLNKLTFLLWHLLQLLPFQSYHL